MFPGGGGLKLTFSATHVRLLIRFPAFLSPSGLIGFFLNAPRFCAVELTSFRPPAAFPFDRSVTHSRGKKVEPAHPFAPATVDGAPSARAALRFVGGARPAVFVDWTIVARRVTVFLPREKKKLRGKTLEVS